MKIKCKYDKLLPISKVKPNPKNPNEHPNIQLEGLKITLKENEIRHPLVISNQSGLLVAGHARLETMKRLGMKKVPVVYQDFDSEEKEFQFMVSDNESQRKSYFNPIKFNNSIKKLKIEKINYNAMGIYDQIITIPPAKNEVNPQDKDNQDTSQEKENPQASNTHWPTESTGTGVDPDVQTGELFRAFTCPKCGHSFSPDE